jgi:hypothetical protein
VSGYGKDNIVRVNGATFALGRYEGFKLRERHPARMRDKDITFESRRSLKVGYGVYARRDKEGS